MAQYTVCVNNGLDDTHAFGVCRSTHEKKTHTAISPNHPILVMILGLEEKLCPVKYL